MRPAELGTVRLMNLIAAWRTTHGRSASGAGTAPRTEMPDPTKAVWARIRARSTHASSASLSSFQIVSNPMSASWLMSR